MFVFAVQAIPQEQAKSEFAIVAANSPEEALAFTSQQYIEAGKPNTAMVAVFAYDELEALVSAMRTAKDNLPSAA